MRYLLMPVLMPVVLLVGCTTLEAPGVPESVVAYCKDRARLAGTTEYGGLAGVVDIAEKKEAAFRVCLYEEGYASQIP